MKAHKTRDLISPLLKVAENMRLVSDPDSRASTLRSLDLLIANLTRIRSELSNPDIQKRASDVRGPLNQVIEFLNNARSDEALMALVLMAAPGGKQRPKRVPVEIPANLTNQQIRALLEKDLSKDELRAIAAQRAISVGKSSTEQIRRDILRNLERQEGYGRLANS